MLGRMRSSRLVVLFTAALGFAAVLPRAPAQAQPVTYEQLRKAAGDSSSWLMYGRDYYGHRYVELDRITPANVDRLHPVWVFATGGENRGLEATPLIHDGVLYVSADGSRVFAIDARTGARKWSYDPELSDETERVYCCGSINRGVAIWGDLVYIGTMDARLVALDMRTGDVVWEVEVIDWEQGYSITGAPLVVKDMVLTGVAGGEFGIRGFVKAFDAEDRRAALDGVHDSRSRRAGQRHLARRHLEARRRLDLDHRRLRPGSEPRLLEYRQRRSLELPRPQGRQPMVGGHHCHQCR